MKMQPRSTVAQWITACVYQQLMDIASGVKKYLKSSYERDA
jgi:hypothetical protein